MSLNLHCATIDILIIRGPLGVPGTLASTSTPCVIYWRYETNKTDRRPAKIQHSASGKAFGGQS